MGPLFDWFDLLKKLGTKLALLYSGYVVKWIFLKNQPGETEIDDPSDKFFAGLDFLELLVRESIQNSLDATRSRQPAKVSFNYRQLNRRLCRSLKLTTQPTDNSDPADFLDYHLKECGLDVLDQGPIDLLVVEDFNTSGLVGDRQKKFIKSANITSKTKGGGSHGIGKISFYILSAIKTIVIYSVFDRGSTFVARSTLKTHGEKVRYKPHGDLDLSHNQELIGHLFDRQPNQPGLSVAVLYPNLSTRQKQNQQQLKTDISHQVLKEYYWPIFQDRLNVSVGDKDLTTINLKSFLDPKFDLCRRKLNILQAVKTDSARVTKVGLNLKKKDFIAGNYLTKDDLVFKQIRQTKILDVVANQNDAILVLDINLEITRFQPPGRLRVIVAQNKTSKKVATDYWRGDILVKKATGAAGKQDHLMTIVIIESDNNPLEKLLRKTEDPGHTRWQKQKQALTIGGQINLSKKDVNQLIDAVKNLPKQIEDALKHQPTRSSRQIFAQFFYYLDPKVAPESINSRSSTKPTSNQPVTIDRFVVERLDGGFMISFNRQHSRFSDHLPIRAQLRVAYASRGDPFKKYDQAYHNHQRQPKTHKEPDFILDNNNSSISTDHHQVEIISRQQNRLEFKIINPNFWVKMTGFDNERELRVEITA